MTCKVNHGLLFAMITKKDLLRHFKTEAAIASCLGITRQAVNRWGADRPIPREQELRLKYELAPNLFKKTQNKAA